ncbi:hypothetical protein Ddye_024213 [Dipteronia dyeriana]|uniref:Endonuclease/exonuclease/phosphatase family protein n=1 Tax=Dipteronia dyeriana TaxID=168575 RepID=A0AAD9WU83_9ROSI|nr:hypothetical protein Ddye_024213 [Dipteronia dyeriana]
MKRLHDMVHIPWFCAGDFNDILSPDEKIGGLPRNRMLIDNFRNALDYCGLDDMGFQGPRFTWSNKRNGCDLVQERLDRGVCDSEWYQLFPRASIYHLEYWHSDHRPHWIEFSGLSGNFCNRNFLNHFHFAACWVEKEDCRRLIEECWGSGIWSTISISS